MSGWSLIEYIFFCHVLWWIFYYLLVLGTRQSAEWCCRFVTLIHGCLVSYAAIRDIISRDAKIKFECHSLSEAQKTYLSYMLSYFIFDFGWMHFFGNEKWIIYVHHVTSIAIIINVLFRSYGGDGVSYGVAGLELTNPYLQLRWFLRTHGQLNKPLHKFTELWFISIFFLIRMVGGTLLLYRGLLHSDIDYGMKLSFIAIYSISVVLQLQICGFLRKKYLSREARSVADEPRNRDSLSPYFQRQTLENIEDEDLMHGLREIRDENIRDEKNPPLMVVAPPIIASAVVEQDESGPAVGDTPTFATDQPSVKVANSSRVDPAGVEATFREPTENTPPKFEASQGEIPESEKAEISYKQSPEYENLDSTSRTTEPTTKLKDE